MAEIRKPGPKFPPTRLLEAGYGDIVPEGCHDEHLTKELHELVQSSCCQSDNNHQCRVPSPVSDECSLYERAERLKAKLTQQTLELRRFIHLQEEAIRQSLPKIRHLINAARAKPSLTAVTLSCCKVDTPTLSRVKRRGTVSCCKCSQKALPFTRFCLDHVHLNRDQTLYRRCLATDQQTKLRCKNPVSDILSLDTTCHQHLVAGEVGGVNKQLFVHKRGMGRGGVGKGALPGSRSKVLKAQKLTPKKTPLPNILKPHKPAVTKPEPPKDPNSLQPRSSLDDLLTLGPPLQSLDLPPLEADLGDIMMAGEESGGEGT